MPSDEKQDEPKTERFNMFMSPSEMKAIDDWAWENRIRSKSEAVRRLVQIGLAFDADAKRIEKSSERALQILFHSIDKLKKEHEKDAGTRGSTRSYLTLVAALASQIDMHQDIARLFVSSTTFSARETELDHALEIIDGLRALVDPENKK